MHQVYGAYDKEGALLVIGSEVMLRVAINGKGSARRQRAHRAGSDVHFLARNECLKQIVCPALALFARFVGISAHAVAHGQLRAVAARRANGATV